MKMKMLAILGMAVGFVGVSPESGHTAEVKLKAAAFLPGGVYVKYFKDWVKHTNKQCTGHFNISVVGPAAVKSMEQWNALKNGVIDLHYGPPNYYKGVMPVADVMILSKNETAAQRKNGAWKMMNEMHKKKMNAIYLTNILNGVKFYLYTNKPAVNKRFEGFRLRSVAIYDGFFKSLGAMPLRMAAPQVYTALERKTVDGYGWPLWGIKYFGWDKHTKYRHGPGFFSANVNIIANQDKYNGMSSAARKCMMDQAIWLESEWPSWRSTEAAKQTKPQDDAGIKYVDMGASFPKKAEDMYWAMLLKADSAFINKIRPLLSK